MSDGLAARMRPRNGPTRACRSMAVSLISTIVDRSVMSTTAKPYKDTLNLPVTKFDMKANLAVREPQIQARWHEQDLYGTRPASPERVGREGSCTTAPPMPTARSTWGPCSTRSSRTSSCDRSRWPGFDSPYVPGWDCHGLPIEHKVVKDLGSKAQAMSHAADPFALPRPRP